MPETRIITLSKGFEATVDAEDYERVAAFKWYAAVDGNVIYVQRKGRRSLGELRTVRLHRFILNAEPGVMIDHINGNGLDNRKENLRVCDNQRNQFNMGSHKIATSRFKGVSWCNRPPKWKAGIRVNGKAIHLGYFESELDAARAYDVAAKKYHGQFARLNIEEDARVNS